MREGFGPYPEHQGAQKIVTQENELQQNDEEVRFERRQGISDAAKLQTANDILENLEKHSQEGMPLYRPSIERRIYGYMANRKSPAETKMLFSKFNRREQVQYENILEQQTDVARNFGYEVSDGAAWFSVWAKNDAKIPPMSLKVSEKETVRVIFKEYFSLIPVAETHNGVCEEIYRFLHCLNDLAEKLKELGIKHDDEIKLKIPSDLLGMLSHLDSLVVHYRNKDLGPEIRKIVEDWFASKHLRTGRKDRIESGFDFKSSRGKYAKLSGSHSELIARILSYLIVENTERNGHFMYRNPKDFSQWLNDTASSFGQISPEYLLKHLQNVKE